MDSQRYVPVNPRNKHSFKFNKPAYLKAAQNFFDWSTVRVRWDDFEYNFGKQDCFDLENGGKLIPFSTRKILYYASNGKVITLPARAYASLNQVINDIESGETSNLNLEVEGIRGNIKKIWRRFKNWKLRANK